MTSKLARVVSTKDGATLRTRAHARDYMLSLPDQRARYQAWQHAARLLLNGEDGERLTTQIEYALMLDGHRRF